MAEVIYVAFARTLWPPPPPPRLAAPSSPHTRRAGNADDQGVAATSPAEAVSRVGEPPSSAVTARSAVQRRGRAAPDGGAQQGENGRRGRPNLDDLEEPLLLGGGDASTAGAASTPAGIAVCEEGARGGADDGDDEEGAADRRRRADASAFAASSGRARASRRALALAVGLGLTAPFLINSTTEDALFDNAVEHDGGFTTRCWFRYGRAQVYVDFALEVRVVRRVSAGGASRGRDCGWCELWS